MSAVSGGAVIAAMYAYSQDSFEDFEARTVKLLRSGLVGQWLRRVLLPSHLLASLSVHAIAGTAALGAAVIRRALSIGSGNSSSWCEKIHAPFYRSVSRTTAFEGALRNMLFHDLVLTDPRRDNIDIVLNACELRTGSAFRFGNKNQVAGVLDALRATMFPLPWRLRPRPLTQRFCPPLIGPLTL
jgi:NTE family protein